MKEKMACRANEGGCERPVAAVVSYRTFDGDTFPVPMCRHHVEIVKGRGRLRGIPIAEGCATPEQVDRLLGGEGEPA